MRKSSAIAFAAGRDAPKDMSMARRQERAESLFTSRATTRSRGKSRLAAAAAQRSIEAAKPVVATLRCGSLRKA
jgi:hypothetical protein